MGEDTSEPPTVEKLIEVQIGDEEHKTTSVGADLPAHERDGLITLLRENADVFAWSFAEMPGIDSNAACHRLNIDEKFHPYPRWLSNVVPVPKKNGKIRVCIDFTDLNKACLSDPYPLPWIRYLVDATSGYGRLSFMDGFSGYNQMHLFEEDQENTAFVTDRGVYCYTVMSLGIKNAGETYQHLVDHMFKDLIGKSMKVYIDDMVVKSEKKESHFLDLQKTFDIIRQYQMKLNPAKCSFGLSSGKFLRYLMTHRGIEANPEQIRAIREIPSPRTKKEVQKLAGRLASLNRFISRSSDRFKPFFDVLNKPVNFGFTNEYEKAFNEIKQYLSTPPVLHSSTAEKGHALAALLADFPMDDIETVAGEEEELFKPTKSVTDQTWGESAMEVDTPEPLCTVFTDGSSNVGGSGVGCVIFTPQGSRIEKATRLGFQASNNEAEYEAAIIGLKAVKQLNAKNVKLRPQLENRHADALAYLSSAVETDTTRFVVVNFQELHSISYNHFVLDLEHASGGERTITSSQGDTENIDSNMDVDSPVIDDPGNHAENVADWRQPYIQYLTTGELPKDEHLASKVKKNAWRYSMIEGQLYRKPVDLEPFLRCILAEEGQQIFAEAHEGICGSHSGGCILAHRILTMGYFLLYMQKDAKEYA
ncbi:uncharacterized protein LOC113326422 [Papaver somniferum]|uniref:uncharacterized protein LOC113326422 n=1 Tax=Papaver somniferum TaxID=3469 RepID=UPI000E6FB7B2|nr:uncharacterized protein LOC113326422 [Papaver somniferum]